MKNKKVFLYVVSLFIISIFVFFIGKSFSLSYNEEIKSVEIQSEDYDAPGSWHITKSADWTDTNKARVTFDVTSVDYDDTRYKDVILIIDVSGSMAGNKIERAKRDALEVANSLLSDTHNRIALIFFTDVGFIKSQFTNDLSTISTLINNAVYEDNTNYNDAFLKVDEIMQNYQKEDDKDLIVLFLTDGYPNVDTPNQVATYQMLKDKYPYMIINGIQYEMGNKIIQAIIDVSDNQWIADMETLNNALFNASNSINKYENFVVTDYIDNDNFYINSVDDVEVPFGEVRLEEENGIQKITWDLGNKYIIGQNLKMFINLTLKEEQRGQTGYFATNKKEVITSKLQDESEKNLESTLTPVLKGSYKVIYDYNAPSDCNLQDIEEENHFPYEYVTKKSSSVTCSGYDFGGWKIDSEDAKDIKIINDDVFVMPSHDVTIRATWKKVYLAKSMNGEVKGSVTTLYDIMRTASVPDDRASTFVTSENGIDFSQPASDTNGKGVYELRTNNAISDAKDTPIYYFRGKVDNTFVLFGGYCWQIVRTTSNKGIKLLYAGLPTGDNNDKCTGVNRNLSLKNSWFPPEYTYDSSSTLYYNGLTSYYNYGGYMINQEKYDSLAIGKEYQTRKSWYYSSQQSVWSFDTIYYSSEYNYNEETGMYTLSNPLSCTGIDCRSVLLGKYTFNAKAPDAESDFVYWVSNVSGSSSRAEFYGRTLRANATINDYANAVFGTGFIDNGDGTYTLTGTETLNLANWDSRHSRYKNYFMCDNYKETCKNFIFIIGTSGSYSSSYAQYIDGGTKIYVSLTSDGNTLVNPVQITMYDWLTNDSYANYNYFCKDHASSCSKDNLMHANSKYSTGYMVSYNRIYGKSITYDGQYYHLQNTIDQSETHFLNYNSGDVTKYHFVCPGYNETKCEKVYFYIHGGGPDYTDDRISSILVLSLENGETDVVKVFNERKNVEVDQNKNPINYSKDSILKIALDHFYEENLINYEKYIDDAVWCNDKTMTQENINNSYLSGNNMSDLRYDAGLRTHQSYKYNNPLFGHPKLTCDDKLDAFTVNDTVNGNGFLKHPIAAITADEYFLGGQTRTDTYLGDSNYYYWTISPAYSYGGGDGNMFVDSYGMISYGSVGREVKPSIVLKPGIDVIDGDGTKENPYKLDTPEVE